MTATARPVYQTEIPNRLGHFVYRLWDREGVCLYVGCTGERNPRRVTDRLRAHRRDKEWWDCVHRIEVAVFSSSADVCREEELQIAGLSPLYNRTLRTTCPRGHNKEPNKECQTCKSEYRRQRRINDVEYREREREVDRKRVRIRPSGAVRAKIAARRPTAGQNSLWT